MSAHFLPSGIRSPLGPRFIMGLGLGMLAFLLYPSSLASQLGSPLEHPTLQHGPAFRVCTEVESLREGIWPTVLGAMGSQDREAWRPRLRALEDSMAVVARGAPTDPRTQYLYAVVMGARTDVESGGTKIRKAKELLHQVDRLLELNPDHPGALYIKGRLNAAVMRLGRIQRFIATKLLGGGLLSSASWAEAQRLLEAAAERDPCVPDHHLELAMVYVDTDQTERALAELDLLLRVLTEDDRGQKMARRAHRLIEKLEQTQGGKD